MKGLLERLFITLSEWPSRAQLEEREGIGVEGKDVTQRESGELVMDWMWGEGDSGVTARNREHR